MKESQDKQVKKFLDDIMLANQDYYQIIQQLREIVFSQYPNIHERIMYGGIMFSIKDDVGGLFVCKHHVSFEFSKGYVMNDPKKLLNGSGKFRRHLTFATVEDIKDKEVEFFVKQLV
jgi:hypothetical protein